MSKQLVGCQGMSSADTPEHFVSVSPAAPISPGWEEIVRPPGDAQSTISRLVQLHDVTTLDDEHTPPSYESKEIGNNLIIIPTLVCVCVGYSSRMIVTNYKLLIFVWCLHRLFHNHILIWIDHKSKIQLKSAIHCFFSSANVPISFKQKDAL